MSASASSSRSTPGAAARWKCLRRGSRCSIAPEGETGHLSGTPSKIEVAIPAGVDPSKPVVATTELKLDQRWQPAPTGAFKAGDALVRTINRQAAGIPGMAMLDLTFAAPPGVRV